MTVGPSGGAEPAALRRRPQRRSLEIGSLQCGQGDESGRAGSGRYDEWSATSGGMCSLTANESYRTLSVGQSWFILAPETANFSSDVSTASPSPASDSAPEASDFIRKAIRDDLAAGRFDRVQTRWPPEPNGYIGIGHAKAITLNFDVAREFVGFCSLRFDDTNPEREKLEYVESIKEDIRWLGFDWATRSAKARDSAKPGMASIIMPGSMSRTCSTTS